MTTKDGIKLAALEKAIASLGTEEEREQRRARERAEKEAQAKERERLETEKRIAVIALGEVMAENERLKETGPQALIAAIRTEGERTRTEVRQAAQQLAGRKRGLDMAGNLVELFRRYEKAQKEEEGTHLEILCGYSDPTTKPAGVGWGGVMGDMAEEGITFNSGPKYLDERFSEWRKLGKPQTGEEYTKKRTEARRRERRRKG
jgi:hypothetical protein